MDIKALDAFLQSHLEQEGIPGFSVALAGPAGTLLEKGYGFADHAHSRPMDPDTVCGVASMSKSMTALAAAILEQEGKLRYDDPVSKYLPGFTVRGIPAELVTLAHLARHTSGLPSLPCLSWSLAWHNRPEPWREGENARRRAASRSKIATIDDMLAYIREEAVPLGMPGEYMSYSNDSYALLSSIVDLAAGKPLEEFLEERLFAPLGMARTVLDLDGSRADRIAAGNRTELFVRDEDGLHHTLHWDVAPPFRGCHAVKSTARDMVKYYQMLSQGGLFRGRRIVPEAAVERMAGRFYPALEEGCYCLGLDKRYYRGHVICEHSGGLTGISSKGGFLLGEGVAAVILCNLEEANVSDAQNAMYNHVMGLPLDQSHQWLIPVGHGPADPGFYPGTYRMDEGFSDAVIQVKLDGDGLRLRIVSNSDGKVEEEMKLLFCRDSTFLAVGEGQPIKRGTVTRFLVRDGRAWAVRMGTRINPRVD